MMFVPTPDTDQPPMEAFATLGHTALILGVVAVLVAIASTLILTVGRPDGRLARVRPVIARVLFIAVAVAVLGGLFAAVFLV
jgi:hypothetical protein